MYRQATDQETTDWLAGNADVEGAVGTDHGLLVPTFYGACGVRGCKDCRPLYDEANNPIAGTDQGSES